MSDVSPSILKVMFAARRKGAKSGGEKQYLDVGEVMGCEHDFTDQWSTLGRDCV